MRPIELFQSICSNLMSVSMHFSMKTGYLSWPCQFLLLYTHHTLICAALIVSFRVYDGSQPLNGFIFFPTKNEKCTNNCKIHRLHTNEFRFGHFPMRNGCFGWFDQLRTDILPIHCIYAHTQTHGSQRKTSEKNRIQLSPNIKQARMCLH